MRSTRVDTRCRGAESSPPRWPIVIHSVFMVLSAGLLSILLLGCVSPPERERSGQRTEKFISGGRPIKVEVFAPESAGRVPAVLVLYGSGGALVGKSEMVRLCRDLSRTGHAAMLVHYFNRTGTLWSTDEKNDRLWPVWADTVKDAVTFAAAHPQVDPDAIGLFGYSLGGFLAVEEATRNPRVRAVAELAGGPFAGRKPAERKMPPVLVLHGREDQRVPVAQAFAIAQAARETGTRPTVKIYEGEGHALSSAALQDAMKRTREFFKRTL